jgi:hypothetical protein
MTGLEWAESKDNSPNSPLELCLLRHFFRLTSAGDNVFLNE